MNFLSTLKPKYKSIHSQILAGSDIGSLTNSYARVMRVSTYTNPSFVGVERSALITRSNQVGRGGGRSGRDGHRRGGRSRAVR